MNWLSKEVPIPSPLRYLHGASASRSELCLNYGLVLLTAWAFLGATPELEGSPLRRMLLLLLAMDLTGGVICNVIKGAQQFYSQSIKRRLLFIGFHIVQPLLLLWLFPLYVMPVVLLTLNTLSAAAVVSRMTNNPSLHKVLAVSLLAAGTLGLLLTSLPAVLTHLIILFQIKLIVSFAVKW